MQSEFDIIQPQELSLNDKLAEAVADGDIKKINTLLKKGADINYVPENGATPLDIAVLMNYPDVVKHLITKGADLNKIAFDGGTALDLANQLFILEKQGGNDKEKLRLIQECRYHLLEAGARTAQSINGYLPTKEETPSQEVEDYASLSAVARTGNMVRLDNYCLRYGLSQKSAVRLLNESVGEGWTRVISFLAKRGLSLDGQDENGDTPLIKAARLGHKEVCETLLNEGANPEVVNNQQHSAFEVAIKEDQGEVVTLFLQNEKTNLAFIDKEHLLKSAIEHGRFYLAVELIENEGFDKTDVLFETLKPHHEVAYQKDKPDMDKAHKARTRLAQWLINKGADLSATDEDGNTPLMVAYQYGHQALAMPMIQRGADVNIQNNNGVTPLMLSVLTRTDDATEEMLLKGADPLKKTVNGWTALMLAGESGHIDMFKYLINHGAEQDLTTGTGGRAMTFLAENLSSASEETAAKILSFLREREAKLRQEKRKNRFSLIRKLAGKGPKS